MADKIFISYRRDESSGHAGRVRDRLEAAFGGDVVFMDVDSIQLGVNFLQVLHEQIESCSVLLAMIGRGWLDVRDHNGNRRLDDPNDFVRIEIASALHRDIPVIPIFLGGASVPDAARLPEDLKTLSLRNGLEVRDASFHPDVDKLIKELKRLSAEQRARQEAERRQRAAEATVATPRPRRWHWAAGAALALGILALATMLFFKQAEQTKAYATLSDLSLRIDQNDSKVKSLLEENALLRLQLRVLTSPRPQYVVEKWNLEEAHRLSQGEDVLIATIDDGVDAGNPELAGTVAAQFDAVGAGCKTGRDRGTGSAGAIAAHGRLIGVAPKAKILSVCAFTAGESPQSTTVAIVKGLEFAVTQGARVIVLGFAGPRDPILDVALKKIAEKGVVLIAAAGNAGPKSPPLFPGASPSVIAVTAADQNNAVYAAANRGRYIAVTAPGVDVLVPAPNSGYQVSTGTMIAAALAGGVAALLIAQKPARTPADIRRILTATATPLGARDVFGAGMIDPLKALQQTEL